MAKDWAAAFYASKRWQMQRAYILGRDKYTCQAPGCHDVATEVHHIVELTPENIHDPRIALGEDNLTSLCRACHQKITKQEKRLQCEQTRKRSSFSLPQVLFDADGYPLDEMDTAVRDPIANKAK